MILEIVDEDEYILLSMSTKENYYYSQDWFRNILLRGLPIQINNAFRFGAIILDQLIDIFIQGSGLNRLEYKKRFLCFIYYIGRKISYRDLGEKFGISNSTAFKYVIYTTNSILKLKDIYLKLPSSDEFEGLAIEFQRYSAFPNTVLAIDGTHIPIKLPSTNSSRYINRKGSPSLNILIACDSFFRIRYVYGGTFGSSHDSFVFNASNLPTWGEINLQNFNNENLGRNNSNLLNYHILGDAAYPNKPFLKTPYKGSLTSEQERFSNLIIPQRIVVERTIGYFKTKFQKFRFEACNGEKENMSKIFFAAVIIYNLTIDERMSSEFYNIAEVIMEEEREINE